MTTKISLKVQEYRTPPLIWEIFLKKKRIFIASLLLEALFLFYYCGVCATRTLCNKQYPGVRRGLYSKRKRKDEEEEAKVFFQERKNESGGWLLHLSGPGGKKVKVN